MATPLSTTARTAVRLLAPLALLLALAMPAAAAPIGSAGGAADGHAQLSDGTVCGTVTAFTAPVAATTDGSITINGTTDPVDADATIAAALATYLSTAATAGPLYVCLEFTVEGDGTDAALVTGIAADAAARVCGTVSAVGTGDARVYTIGGAALPATTTLDATLRAFLDAAITANAQVCLDVTADATTGAVTAAANLDATLAICGQVVATGSGDARVYTIGGISIPAAQLSASERAALDLALANQTNACADVVIEDTQIVSANVRIDVCVTVNAVSANSVTLDGVVLPLAAGTTVPTEVRANANLGLRITFSANDAMTLQVITLSGCTQSGTAGGAAGLPNTAVAGGSGSIPVIPALGLALVAAGAGLKLRRLARVSA